ncbi:hypothetical protein [Noviherbaspirillum sp. ST9]|uniref:hypothetical protein n=1 Tax=Noviherbaspirillum sp. ST9 TaxID=3401606 RepID=UPI003B586F0E
MKRIANKTRTGIAAAALLAAGCGGGGGENGPATTLASSITNPSPAWTIDAPFENEAGKAEYPSVAIAASGDTITVFAQRTGTRLAVFAVHGNVNSAEVRNPRMIDRPETSAQPSLRSGGKFVTATQVAINTATGDAIAVWSATAGSASQVWAARYARASDTWLAPVRLDSAATGASYPVLAMNAQGSAIAAWSEGSSISAAYFTGGTWRNPARLSTGEASAPQAAIDAVGNAHVAWVEKDTSGADNIVVSRLTGSGAPSAPRVIDVMSAPASAPSVAVAPNGSALAAWLQDDGVYASRFTDGTWSAPLSVDHLPGRSNAPFAALNDSGGFVAWEQETQDAASASAYAVRLNGAGNWSTPVNVYNRGGFMPVVRLRDNGDAMMVWLAAHTQFATWSASTGAWSSVVNLAPYNCGSGHALAMDAASGKAVAAWIPSNCSRNNDLYGAFYR